MIQPRAADMRGRGVIEEVFDGIPVEPGYGAQPTRDGGPGPAAGPQGTGSWWSLGISRIELRPAGGWASRGPSDGESFTVDPPKVITQSHTELSKPAQLSLPQLRRI